MDHEIERARESAVRYVGPASLDTPEGRFTRVPATVPLATSYATQEHTSLRQGWRAVVRGRLDRTVETPDGFYGMSKWMLSAWNPNGELSTKAENVERTIALLRELWQRRALVSEVLATMPPDRGWVEDTVVFVGLTDVEVLALARDLGQPAISAWRDTFLTVIPTGLVDGIEEVTREAIVELRPTTCPMRIDDVEGARCAIEGGPYGTRAIHAGAIWSHHRDRLVSRLGCAPCAASGGGRPGALDATGGPIMIDELGMASRYGGYAWR